MQVESRKKWELAMEEEMDSLMHNQTWDLVRLPAGKTTLKNKWVYRLKEEDGGKQRTILSLVAAEDLHLEQLDVKTAFLHGDLEEEIYMQQPQGYEVKGKEKLVCRLKKRLYGLKQAPRQWYLKFDKFMSEQGNKCAQKKIGKFICNEGFGSCKTNPKTRDRKNSKLTLSQNEYVQKVLKIFNMHKAKPVSTPFASDFKHSKEMCPKTQEYVDYMSKVPYASAVGSLMYAMVCTRPDIAHAVGVVSRECDAECTVFEITGEHYRILFTVGEQLLWVSKIQSVVALSTTEAEYVAATEASKEMIWLQRFMGELGKEHDMGMLYSDSQSAIHLAKNSSFHSRTKHIQLK
eukprot:PITA_34205